MDRQEHISCRELLGGHVTEAIASAGEFLRSHRSSELLGHVGEVIPDIVISDSPADKTAFPVSYGGGKPCGEDLLTGQGAFYVTESGKLMLDCTSGHYQMSWGYNPPALVKAMVEGAELGVVWDNHGNIPSVPVKLLADRLTALARKARLDRCLLGVCTGSVACGTALKLALARYERRDGMKNGAPVMVTLAGNYHGTDMLLQAMRGMWQGLVTGIETVEAEPNDHAALRDAFARYGRRIAAFWAEPVMMNREAILVENEFLGLARRLCTESGALMVLDEIQTGFWYPEGFFFLRSGIHPDIVVLGKGMTAGFHPLAGLLFNHDLDILAQYDAISTNGNASLAALVALANLRLLEQSAGTLQSLHSRYENGLRRLAADLSAVIEKVHGAGFLCGLKFRDRNAAIAFQRAAVAHGLWVRVHAYHEGHRTVLTKLPLVVNEDIVDFVLKRMRGIVETQNKGRA